MTDVTNASRTLLMNIETLNWDPLLLKTFSLELDMLPEIRSSSEIYGEFKAPDLHPLNGIKICAVSGVFFHYEQIWKKKWYNVVYISDNGKSTSISVRTEVFQEGAS